MRQYTLDGVSISSTGLITQAETLDREFAGSWVQTVSEAIRILREHGHTVEDLTNQQR